MDDGLNWWTNGFWGGIMWLLYQNTGEERYARIARISERRLEKCFEDYYGLHHDVGFMFMPTAVADYRLTENEDSRRIGLHAANLLAGRFNSVGRFIRAWNDLEEDTRGWAIIDCMFNISQLYWACGVQGKRHRAAAVVRKALRTKRRMPHFPALWFVMPAAALRDCPWTGLFSLKQCGRIHFFRDIIHILSDRKHRITKRVCAEKGFDFSVKQIFFPEGNPCLSGGVN